MKAPDKYTVAFVVLILGVVFLIDYANVSLCKDVSVPYKCRNYIEYRFG